MQDMLEIKELCRKLITSMKNLDQDAEMVKKCKSDRIGLNHWGWISGVGLYSLAKYWQYTSDEETFRYLTQWYHGYIDRGLPRKTINSVCPLLALTYVMEREYSEKFIQTCTEWAEWIIKDMPRTEEMGLQHITVDENYQQLWDDTLFVTVLFLARMGKLLKKEEYTAEATRQFLVHIKYLVDKKNGLFFHGWTFDGNHNFGEAHWARGNCWYTAGVVEFIEIMGEHLDQGVKLVLLDTLKSQIKALGKYQNPNGMWNTLIDVAESYQEASATAAFAYGMMKAIRLGYLEHEYSSIPHLAFRGILQRIDEDGMLQEVSAGTPMGNDLELYKNIPLCPMAYGQAFALLLVLEAGPR